MAKFSLKLSGAVAQETERIIREEADADTIREILRNTDGLYRMAGENSGLLRNFRRKTSDMLMKLSVKDDGGDTVSRRTMSTRTLATRRAASQTASARNWIAPPVWRRSLSPAHTPPIWQRSTQTWHNSFVPKWVPELEQVEKREAGAESRK